MRRTKLLIGMLCLLWAAAIAACTPRGATPPTPGPKREPTLVAARWPSSTTPYPTTQATAFWAPDAPKTLPARAYGAVAPEYAIYVRQTEVQQFELQATLPAAPAEVAVYVVGIYPAGQADRFRELVHLPQPPCDFVAEYAEFACIDMRPTGPIAPVHTAAEARARASSFLADLLTPDLREPNVTQDASGNWWVVYRQVVNGMVVIEDKPLQAEISPDGQMLYALGRRRPLLELSMYPARTPQAAWDLVSQGKGLAFTLLQGAGAPRGQRFTAVTVELVYVVTHMNEPKEFMRPYYLFRNSSGEGLFAPALADPYALWPPAA